MLHSLNSHVIAEQNLQDRLLSEQTDRLAGRNAMLNRQLQQLVRQIRRQCAGRPATAGSRDRIRKGTDFHANRRTGGICPCAIAGALFRDTPRCQPHRAIQAQDSRADWEAAGILRQNEALIASRKKAVHTITHELRTPLNRHYGLHRADRKEHDPEKTAKYMRNIRQSSDRMRRMLNTLLAFFRLDSGKEQPCLSPAVFPFSHKHLKPSLHPQPCTRGWS